jgi:hypothetical protein
MLPSLKLPSRVEHGPAPLPGPKPHWITSVSHPRTKLSFPISNQEEVDGAAGAR